MSKTVIYLYDSNSLDEDFLLLISVLLSTLISVRFGTDRILPEPPVDRPPWTNFKYGNSNNEKIIMLNGTYWIRHVITKPSDFVSIILYNIISSTT